MVTGAPGVEADGHIEDSENEALYTYYSGYLGGSARIRARGTRRTPATTRPAVTASRAGTPPGRSPMTR
jgi:hypothetical protein